MAARFRVLVVGGRSRCTWADTAVFDYAKRLGRYGGVEEELVRAEPFRGDIAAVRAAEGARLRERVGPKDALIVLDERGDDLDTAGFTALVDGARQVGRVAFALGGAYGHDPATRAASLRVVRLSALVLNHEVARVVLYEQLYRALAALHGVPYAH